MTSFCQRKSVNSQYYLLESLLQFYLLLIGHVLIFVLPTLFINVQNTVSLF